MDVTFLESETFFPPQASNSPLQGKIRDEKEQNWFGPKWLGVEDGPSSKDGFVENRPSSKDGPCFEDNSAHPNDGNRMTEPNVQISSEDDSSSMVEPISS